VPSGGDGDALTRGVADALADERNRRSLSLDDVAARAGVHRTTVGLIERHRRGLTLDVAARLAWALELPLGDLITRVERDLRPDGQSTA